MRKITGTLRFWCVQQKPGASDSRWLSGTEVSFVPVPTTTRRMSTLVCRKLNGSRLACGDTRKKNNCAPFFSCLAGKKKKACSSTSLVNCEVLFRSAQI